MKMRDLKEPRGCDAKPDAPASVTPLNHPSPSDVIALPPICASLSGAQALHHPSAPNLRGTARRKDWRGGIEPQVGGFLTAEFILEISMRFNDYFTGALRIGRNNGRKTTAVSSAVSFLDITFT